MSHRTAALEATRRLREHAARRGLSSAEQASLGADLDRIEAALGGAAAPAWGSGGALATGRRAAARDPYALAQATPADLNRELGGGARPSSSSSAGGTSAAAPPPPTAPPRKTAFEQAEGIGDAVESVNFPGFVAGLITGTFQAIVDATAQQLREYADLVANLSRSVDEFARDHVSADQVRAHLAGKHRELRHVAPPPGSGAETALVLDAAARDTSPRWLADYGLEGEELTPELVAGPLHEAGRTQLAEQRMATLASMVLMGINRIVISDGDIKAKLQFHAAVREKTDVELATSQMGSGIASRGGGGGAQLMVSTMKANTQAEASVKANLTGEVRIQFRTETFPLERFADSQAIQLLNRHARWRGDAAGGAAGAASGPGEASPPGGAGRREGEP
jgi:hypothetical protein